MTEFGTSWVMHDVTILHLSPLPPKFNILPKTPKQPFWQSLKPSNDLALIEICVFHYPEWFYYLQRLYCWYSCVTECNINSFFDKFHYIDGMSSVVHQTNKPKSANLMNCTILHYLLVVSDCIWSLTSNVWRHSFTFISPTPKIQDFSKDTKQPFWQSLKPPNCLDFMLIYVLYYLEWLC